MASIKDSIEESFQDTNAISKYFLFAIPLYITYYMYKANKESIIFIIAAVFSFMLLLGILTICTMNVRNNKNQILPSLNIITIFKEAITCLLAIGPAIAINIGIAAFITSRIEFPSHGFDLTIKIFIWLAFLSVIFTSYLLFVKDKKIKDAYNLKSISDFGADIMVSLIFMVPQIIIADGVLLGVITYILGLFFGLPNPIWEFICCMFVVQNMALIGNYLAQIALESIEIKVETEKYDSGQINLN